MSVTTYKYSYEDDFLFETRRRLTKILIDKGYVHDQVLANSRALAILNHIQYGVTYSPEVQRWIDDFLKSNLI